MKDTISRRLPHSRYVNKYNVILFIFFSLYSINVVAIDCTYNYTMFRDNTLRWNYTLILGNISYNTEELHEFINNDTSILTVTLAQRQIATKLNVANGANPSSLGSVVDDVDIWLITYPIGTIVPDGSDKDDGVLYQQSLEGYNTGVLGPGVCSGNINATTCLVSENMTLSCTTPTTTGPVTTGVVTTGVVTTGVVTTGVVTTGTTTTGTATTGPGTTGVVTTGTTTTGTTTGNPSTTTSTTGNPSTTTSTTGNPSTTTTSNTTSNTTTTILVELTTGADNNNNNNNNDNAANNDDGSSTETLPLRDILIIASIGTTVSVAAVGIGLRYYIHKKNKDKDKDKITMDDLEDVVTKVMTNSATMSRAPSQTVQPVQHTPNDMEEGNGNMNFDDLMNNSFVDNPLDIPEEFHDIPVIEPEEANWDTANVTTANPKRNTVYNLDSMFEVNLSRE